MNNKDILKVLGESGMMLEGMDIVDQIAEDKGYGRLRTFLFCSFSLVYPKLHSLENQGLVACKVQPGPFPRKYFYSLTDIGRARYAAIKEQ